MALFGLSFSVTETLLLILTLVITLYFTRRRPKNFPDELFNENMRNFSGPPRLPIIGNLHQMGKDLQKNFTEMQKKYGDIFSVYFGGYPAIILNDYKSIKEAFAEPAFSGRPNFLTHLATRSGGIPRGVIFTHEKVWTEQRRFALKTLRDFGFGKKSMESMVYDEVNELIETFKKLAGKPIKMQNKFNAAVLNALWSLVTGQRYSHDDPFLRELINRLTSSASQANSAGGYAALFFPSFYKFRINFPWLFGASAYLKERTEIREKTFKFMTDNIKEHQNTFQSDATPRDFIDVYLSEIQKATPNSSFYGVDGIKNLTFTMFDLFVAGAETTSTTLTWMFLLMAMNPKSQEILHEEIKFVVGTSRLPTLNDKQKMPYTEAVIMETLRFSTITPFGIFHSAVEDTQFRGYDIPKNTIVIANLYNCMKNTETWGDPNVFRPERFLSPDGKTVIKHKAFLPFSTGRRVCLGETLARDELFLFASSLFQRFKVTPDPNGHKPSLEYCILNQTAPILLPKPQDLIVHDRYE